MERRERFEPLRLEDAEPTMKTRSSVSLACIDCKSRNYKTTKKSDAFVELKKFCKTCKRHTTHRETK